MLNDSSTTMGKYKTNTLLQQQLYDAARSHPPDGGILLLGPLLCPLLHSLRQARRHVPHDELRRDSGQLGSAVDGAAAGCLVRALGK